jgi:predicted glycoside hydrolase/deacetylase ChbG (UPF0249 family)
MLNIHADDLGASRSVTDRILECYDNGVLTSASLMATGSAFEYATEQIRKRPALTVAVHLNLVEGVPLSPPAEVPWLVNERGEFRHGFLSLWLTDLRLGPGDRARFRLQINRELCAQINRVRRHLGEAFPLRIDSHMHLHLTPPFFATLLALAAEFKFAAIRLTNEPWFVHLRRPTDIVNYLGPNLLKHLLLNHLSGRYRRVLQRMGLASNDFFIGILFTGRMTAGAMRHALAALPGGGREGIVEALFHPGSAQPEEAGQFGSRKDLIKAHFAAARQREWLELHSSAMRQVIDHYADLAATPPTAPEVA